jgi:hypothetical protein
VPIDSSRRRKPGAGKVGGALSMARDGGATMKNAGPQAGVF